MKRKVKKVGLFLKRHRKKAVVLACLISFLFVGIWHDYKSSQAVALPFDLLGSLVLEMTMYMAGMSAGEKESEMYVANPYRGSDDPRVESARDNYVRECFPDATFKDLLNFENPGYESFVRSMGALWVNAEYILSRDFCNKVWDGMFSAPAGKPELKPKDVVVNHANATILQFPLNNGNKDDDKEEDDKKGQDAAQAEVDAAMSQLFNAVETSLSPLVFSHIFDTKFFDAVYRILIKLNALQLQGSLDGSSETCDYSSQYWILNPIFINGIGINTAPGAETSFHYFKLYFDHLVEGSMYYPLTYKKNGQVYIGVCRPSPDLETRVAFKLFGSADPDNSLYVGDGRLFKGMTSFNFSKMFSDLVSRTLWQIDFDTLFDAREILGGKMDLNRGEIHCDNLINVDTEANFLKFCQLIQSGKYKLDEVIDLIHDGWKVQINNGKKEWEGIQNGGNTALETLNNPQKGPKYKTDTGKVSVESVKKGVESQRTAPYGQPAYEFLGDPVSATDVDPSPDGQPFPGGDTFPGNQPGTQPGNQPGQGAVSATYPGVTESWWGEHYNPVNGTDPGLNPGINPGTKPENPGNNGGQDDSGKKPFTPGLDEGDGDGKAAKWYERFPFCIPWDLYRLISSFEKPSTSPVFEIPVDFSSVHSSLRSRSIEINFSQFDKVIDVVRAFVLLAYVSGLIIATRNIIKG